MQSLFNDFAQAKASEPGAMQFAEEPFPLLRIGHFINALALFLEFSCFRAIPQS